MPNSNVADKCEHGNAHYCGLCEAEKAPKCKHGNAFYCGLCESNKIKGEKEP